MKRLLFRIFPIFALVLCLVGQEVQHSDMGRAFDLGRNLAFGNAGICAGVGGVGCVGALHSFPLTQQDTGACLYITNNNPTSQHSVSVEVMQTGDSAVPAFTGYSGRFFAVFQNGNQQTEYQNTSIMPQSYLVKANSTIGIFARFAGATRGAIKIASDATAAGTPDTADIYVVQGVQSCMTNNFGAVTTYQQPNYMQAQSACPFIQPISIISAGGAQNFATASTSQSIIVCHISMSSTAAGDVALGYNTAGGVCSSPTNFATYKNLLAMTMNYPPPYVIGPSGTASAGKDFCITTSAGTWGGLAFWGYR